MWASGLRWARRFLQYSFAPHTDIINAFLQTLIGLDDYAAASGNPSAQQLFELGNAQASSELPSFNTGSWSLYQPGLEDDLSYHELVTGFLHQLCGLTAVAVYCSTASEFQADLTTPPALTLLTATARSGAPFTLRFQLSKIAHVGVVVLHGTDPALQTSGWFPHGTDAFAVPALRTPGTYLVRLSATDLAGNFTRITGAVTVTVPSR